MKIITTHVWPPIPRRDWDWCAYHDGEEETNHCGWGATEQEALDDLKRMDAERAEDNDEMQVSKIKQKINENVLACYLSGQISERQWQEHLKDRDFANFIHNRKTADTERGTRGRP